MQEQAPCTASTGQQSLQASCAAPSAQHSIQEAWHDKVELRRRLLQNLQETQRNKEETGGLKQEVERLQLENKTVQKEKNDAFQLLAEKEHEGGVQINELRKENEHLRHEHVEHSVQLNELGYENERLRTENDQLRKHNHILEDAVSSLKGQVDHRAPSIRRRSRRFETVKMLECQRCQQVLTEEEAEQGACCYHLNKPMDQRQWKLIFNDHNLLSDVNCKNDKYYMCCERWARNRPPGCRCVPRHVVLDHGR